MIALRFICVLMLGSLLFSCKNRGSQTVSTTDISMGAQLDLCKLGMDTTWQKMTNSDVNKFGNMTRLVQELKLIDGSESKILDSIDSQIKKLNFHSFLIFLVTV